MQRHYCAIEAALGDAAPAKLLVSRCPAVLAGEDRVRLNLQTLQRLGASPAAAVKVLVSNGRLGPLNLEQPAFAARIEYWQQAYGLETTGEWTGGLTHYWVGMLTSPALRTSSDLGADPMLHAEAAMLQCYGMLHCSLRTVAPRVEFWRDQRPGQPLPTCSYVTASDPTFCQRLGVPLEAFLAFEKQWAASNEGQNVCRHEGPGKARG